MATHIVALVTLSMCPHSISSLLIGKLFSEINVNNFKFN